jgi:hypothetical protein
LHFGHSLGGYDGTKDAAGDLRQQLLGRGAAHQLPLADDGDTLGDRLDVGDDVSGEDDGATVAELGKQVAEAHAFLGVEADRGLVDDQQPRVTEQRLGDADALPHAAREAAQPAVRRRPQVDEVDHLVDRHAQLLAAQPLEPAPSPMERVKSESATVPLG